MEIGACIVGRGKVFRSSVEFRTNIGGKCTICMLGGTLGCLHASYGWKPAGIPYKHMLRQRGGLPSCSVGLKASVALETQPFRRLDAYQLGVDHFEALRNSLARLVWRWLIFFVRPKPCFESLAPCMRNGTRQKRKRSKRDFHRQDHSRTQFPHPRQSGSGVVLPMKVSFWFASACTESRCWTQRGLRPHKKYQTRYQWSILLADRHTDVVNGEMVCIRNVAPSTNATAWTEAVPAQQTFKKQYPEEEGIHLCMGRGNGF